MLAKIKIQEATEAQTSALAAWNISEMAEALNDAVINLDNEVEITEELLRLRYPAGSVGKYMSDVIALAKLRRSAP